jgi:hypothetical protein
MKNAETTKADNANTKKGAFCKTLGSMFTADASETDATARKTAKTAVNELNRFWPARFTICFLDWAAPFWEWFAMDDVVMSRLVESRFAVDCDGRTAAMFVFRRSR